MKKIVLLFFSFIVSILFSLASYAENFYIKNYDVTLDVQANRDIIVTEYIEVEFKKPSHGIFRSIPIKGTLSHDGKSTPYTAKISNVNIDERYSTSYSSDSVVYKIGNPEKKITGYNDYTISYKYSMGNDKLKGSDEFYFNIIGTGWNTDIKRVTFKINFPKEDYEFAKNIGFSMGRNGVSGYHPHHLRYKIQDDKVVVGYTLRALRPNEGITVRALFPDNYFEKTDNSQKQFIVSSIMLALTLFAYLLWFIFGRDEKVIPVVNFYPPKNKNSAEVGVEYKGTASYEELASLVIYLATKGYIEIEDDGISYTLHKLKDYDGKNPYEKRMMRAIFKESNSVLVEELYNSRFFYSNCTAILEALNRIKNYIFDKNANSIEKMIILFVCIVGLLLSIIYVLGGFSFDLICSPSSFILFFPIIGTLAVCSVVYNVFNAAMSPFTKVFQLIFISIWGAMFIGMPLFVFILPMCTGLAENSLILLFGVACLVVSIICLINMPKRNRNGCLALGYLQGFKQFLEVAEKHRLESLLAENPNYISEILPFAYVLGVVDRIMPILGNVYTYSSPSWYRGNMTTSSFTRFGKLMSSASKPSTANGGVSRSSGGSGSSGGGCSGGGGGGGGGGSW